MKRLLVLLCLVPLATAHAVEKPFKRVIQFHYLCRTEKVRLYCSEIKIPLIDKNRVIILPEVYQADVTQLKELFAQLLIQIRKKMRVALILSRINIVKHPTTLSR